MDHIGIDVHKNESQVCILGERGELREQRIRTIPERFAAVLGERPRARILLEASTESEWVARCLEQLGHEVIVAGQPSPPDSRADLAPRAPRRRPWARLLPRVFGFDVLVCDRCGGPRRILGAVTEPHAVRRMLVALGLAAQPPPARPVSAA
jgi:hypothetical protein